MNLKTLKRLALFTLSLCFTLSVNSMVSYAQPSESCRSVNGKFYINDEYNKKCGYLGCSDSALAGITAYDSQSECYNAAIQKYGCFPETENKIFYGTQENGNYRVNFSSNNVSLDDAKSCITNLAKNPNSNSNVLGSSNMCTPNTKFFQCTCTTNLVGQIGMVGQLISWTTGTDTYSCYLKPLTVPQLVKTQVVIPQSPLKLFKVAADTLFVFAIFLFALNFIRVGYLYVRSDGLPDQLKKARNLLFNTISGMIFFILVSGLLVFVNNGFGF